MRASSGRSSPPAPASSWPSSPPRPAHSGSRADWRSASRGGRRPGRRARPFRPYAPQTPQGALALLSYVSPHVSGRLAVAGVAILLGLLTAAIEISNWDVVLRFLHQVPYGESDPVFGKDIGFYLFSLPGLCRAQELAAAAAVLQRGHRRRSLLGAGRHRVRHAAARPVAGRPHPCLGAARPVFRGQGVVLRTRSLPAALQRQRRRRRRRLHRPPRQAADPVAARRTGRRLRHRLMGQCAMADLADSRGGGGAAVRHLVRGRRAVSRAFQPLLCEAERTAARGALYRAQHRLDAAGLQPAADRSEALCGRRKG